MERGGMFFDVEARYFPDSERQAARFGDVKSWAEEISEALKQKQSIIAELEVSGNNPGLVENYSHIKDIAGRVTENDDLKSFSKEEIITLLIETIKVENFEMVGFFDDFLLAWGLNLTEISNIHNYLQKRFDNGDTPDCAEVVELLRKWQV